MNYWLYLQSEEWQIIRLKRLKKDNYTCQRCGCKHELGVHHLTYERLGHEDIDDLLTICARCHNDEYFFGNLVEAEEAMVIRQAPVTQKEYEQARPRCHQIGA